MAPFGQFKPTSTTKPNPKLATTVDDDATWDDLSEKPETKGSPAKSDSAPSPRPSPVITPLPVRGQPIPQSIPLPPAPMVPTFPQSYGPYGYSAIHDTVARHPPTEQQLLEAQLLHIAEVSLGYLNAVHVLESHVSILPPATKANQLDVIVNPTLSPSPSAFSHEGSRQPSRHYFYQLEHQNYTQMVRDMGYLLGLRRAIKILNAAVADTEREDVKYNIKQRAPAPPPPQQPQPFNPMIMPMNQPMYMHPPVAQPLPNSSEKELRSVAKDIVKDTVREYRDNVINPGVEEVQKEMIKLLRDVCRDALAVDKHH